MVAPPYVEPKLGLGPEEGTTVELIAALGPSKTRLEVGEPGEMGAVAVIEAETGTRMPFGGGMEAIGFV